MQNKNGCCHAKKFSAMQTMGFANVGADRTLQVSATIRPYEIDGVKPTGCGSQP
jgi:hypothetical protein